MATLWEIQMCTKRKMKVNVIVTVMGTCHKYVVDNGEFQFMNLSTLLIRWKLLPPSHTLIFRSIPFDFFKKKVKPSYSFNIPSLIFMFLKRQKGCCSYCFILPVQYDTFFYKRLEIQALIHECKSKNNEGLMKQF